MLKQTGSRTWFPAGDHASESNDDLNYEESKVLFEDTDIVSMMIYEALDLGLLYNYSIVKLLEYNDIEKLAVRYFDDLELLTLINDVNNLMRDIVKKNKPVNLHEKSSNEDKSPTNDSKKLHVTKSELASIFDSLEERIGLLSAPLKSWTTEIEYRQVTCLVNKFENPKEMLKNMTENRNLSDCPENNYFKVYLANENDHTFEIIKIGNVIRCSFTAGMPRTSTVIVSVLDPIDERVIRVTEAIKEGSLQRTIEDDIVEPTLVYVMVLRTNVTKALVSRSYEDGDFILDQGKPGQEMFFIKSGEIISIDILIFNGYTHGDSCRTYIIGEGTKKCHLLLDAATNCRSEATNICKSGEKLSLSGKQLSSAYDVCTNHNGNMRMHQRSFSGPQNLIDSSLYDIIFNALYETDSNLRTEINNSFTHIARVILRCSKRYLYGDKKPAKSDQVTLNIRKLKKDPENVGRATGLVKEPTSGQEDVIMMTPTLTIPGIQPLIYKKSCQNLVHKGLRQICHNTEDNKNNVMQRKECEADCYGPQKASHIQIIIRTWSGRNISIKTHDQETILELKKKIEDKEGTTLTSQLLTWNGKILEDTEKTIDLGLGIGSVITLLVQLRGGMEEKKILDQRIRQKRIWKGKLTRMANRITSDIRAQDIAEKRELYDEEYEKVIRDMTELMEIAENSGDESRYYELDEELREMEERDTRINGIFEKLADTSVNGDLTLNKKEKETHNWKKLDKLKKIEIEMFNGNVRDYEKWIATFKACVDTARGSKEEKILHLRQYLSGEPLRLVEPLGFSSLAYDEAMQKLERRYGGEEREYRNIIETVEMFRSIRDGELKDIEQLSELLDVLKIKLRVLGKEHELENGFLYQKLVKKLPETMVLNWARWRKDSSAQKGVQELSEWIHNEAELLRNVKEELGIEDRRSFNMYNPLRTFLPIKREENRSIGSYNTSRTQWPIKREIVKTHVSYPKQVDEVKNRSNDLDQKRKYENQEKLEINKTNWKGCCIVCQQKHFLDKCQTFRMMTVEERKDLVKRNQLCFNCLKANHRVKECTTQKMCRKNDCYGKHSYWLHTNESGNRQNREDEENDTSLLTLDDRGTMDHTKRWISLRTVPVVLESNGKQVEVNALLDDASTVSYISDDVADELKLIGNDEGVPVSVIGGHTKELKIRRVKFTLKDQKMSLKREFHALALKNVVGDLRVVDWKQERKNWKHLKNVKFPNLNKKLRVDVLIGADYLDLHHAIKEITGQLDEPIARLTPLGWTCVGGARFSKPWRHQTNFVRTFYSQEYDLNNHIKRFWEIEEPEPKEGMMFSKVDEEIIEKTKSTMKKECGRFVVKLPWKEMKDQLMKNENMANYRLENLVQRLNKDSELKKEYQRVIKDHEEKGYIKKVHENLQDNTQWLLPHFPVIKKERSSTKVRIVFDAAAKVGKLSLNDVIETGPKLQNDLVDILLRFRKNKIAIACDISEMYLQISITAEDRPYLRFLWKENDKTEVFEFQRLVFGLNTSPFLAHMVSQENARGYQNKYPRSVETILKSTYMDDSLDSVGTIEDALKLRYELEEIWANAGMLTRKWVSNSEQVLNTIPIMERAKELQFDENSTTPVKTLGLKWNARTDTFSFTVQSFQEEKITKRSLLSWIARIFDPLGMLCPYVVRGKILLQLLWMSGADWDEKVPEEVKKEAIRWFKDVEDVKKLSVPRCLLEKIGSNWELHVFSDASTMAFGAVMYIKEESDRDSHIRFISARAKVAPVKTISISRLELLGACVSLKLSKKIIMALNCQIKRVTFWTDSMNVLYWVRQHARKFKTFIANRVGMIQELTEPNQWRYVPTKENPADLLSRGMTGEELVTCRLWWEGPEFLKGYRNTWPKTELKYEKFKDIINREEEEKYIEKENTCLTITDSQQLNVLTKKTCLDPRTYSKWRKLRSVFSWVLRFIENCKTKKSQRILTDLTQPEIEKAEREIVRRSQWEDFKEEINKLKFRNKISETSRLIKLNPFIDEEGCLRSNSRIIYAEFATYNARHPLILSNTNWVTELIIRYYHENLNHYAGVEHILSHINERYWILKGRKVIWKCGNNCLTCKRKRAKGSTQIMAPIPAFRFEEPLGTFMRVAIDFAGPFETIQGRGHHRTKRYLCLFTCLQSRAIHLEMAYGLDTDSLLKAIIRFTSRRGKPNLILTDNGTNFVGAIKEIAGVTVDQYKLTRTLAEQDIRWIFNPPSAPHFGGIFEALIKSAKRAMKAIWSSADVTDEELNTIIIRAEEMVNSRPLMKQNEDEKSFGVLTPNHFIKNKSTIFVDKAVIEPSEGAKMRLRWRRMLELHNHLWRRWMKELIPMWRPRQKWTTIKTGMKKGDLVWILDKENENGKWPLARIIKEYTGSDGQVRVVLLQENNKEILRPISRLFPLEINHDEERDVHEDD